jgi:hypothetical protein
MEKKVSIWPQYSPADAHSDGRCAYDCGNPLEPNPFANWEDKRLAVAFERGWKERKSSSKRTQPPRQFLEAMAAEKRASQSPDDYEEDGHGLSPWDDHDEY